MTSLPQHMHQQVATYLTNTILKHNHFKFNGTMYRQKQGVAVGTKCVPTSANLFMASQEQEFLSVLQKGTPIPMLWIRYIDDIFVIWPDTEPTFLDFFYLLNSDHPNIRYTHDLSTSSIAFLDRTVRKGQRFSESVILDIAPHLKPNFHYQFCHPPTPSRV